MKPVKYLVFLVPYLCAFLIVLLKYEELNIITYLITMIFPMLVSVIILGIGKKRKLYSKSDVFLSLLCTGLYLLYFIATVAFIVFQGAFEYIYQNSQHLIKEGFSIGTSFSPKPFDAVLPCCVCFILHLLGVKVIVFKHKEAGK